MQRVLGLLCLVAVFVGAILTAPGHVEAKSARYERFDVDLVLLEDGSFDITETQVVRFADGPFTQGHREIPTARTGGMTAVQVSELIDGEAVAFEQVPLDELADGEQRYSVVETSNEVQIRWTFEPAFTETRTFVLRYTVLDGLRVYPNENPPNQQIWRTMVGSELTDETPVDSSRMTVTLPESVDLTQVVLESDSDVAPDIPSAHSEDGQVFTFEHGAFGGGEDFTVRLQFPIILEDVAAPAWQAEDDEQRAREDASEEREAVVHLMMLAAGLLLVAGGSTGAYGVWYMRGRDPHVGVVADFLPAPPDDLSPATAGALIDERANECDIVATLLDLARRGAVTMTDVGKLGPGKRATGHDYLFELKAVEPGLAPHELRMLKTVFDARLTAGSKARLSDVAGRVVANFPAFKEELYHELVRHGYFTHSPESTRQSWRRGGKILAAVGAVAGLVGLVAFDAWALIPAAGIVGLGLLFWRMGNAMPRKTAAGAEAAAKWEAFKRYLDEVEKYDNLTESREIFDRYLAYAVAFGLDQSWVRKFARIDTPSPGWFGSGDVYIPTGDTTWRGGSYTSTGNGGSGGDFDFPNIDGPDIDWPDLQSGSNHAGSTLQSGSSGLMEVLKVAGAIIEIAAAFSGGGGKGGSSGGGGGGFN